MLIPELTLGVHRDYLEEILGERARVEINKPSILLITKLLDPTEKYWHVESKTIWRIEDWKRTQEFEAERKRLHEEYRVTLDKRKGAIELLTLAAQQKFLLDPNIARAMALSILHKENIGLALHLGVDIQDLPKLPNKHIVMDGKNTYEL